MEESTGELSCPAGRGLKLTTARSREHRPGRSAIIFRRPVGGCQDCGVRVDCLRSPDPLSGKYLEVSVAVEISGELRSRLSSVRRPESWLSEVNGSSGSVEVLPSRFLPREARRLSAERCSSGSLRLRVEDAPPRPPRPRLLAVDVADRQRRRKTWSDNVARYALPPGTRLHVEVSGPTTFTSIFVGDGQRKISLGGSG